MIGRKSVLIFTASVFLVGCGGPKEPAGESKHVETTPVETKAAKDELIISRAEQATAKIATEPARLSRQPDMIHAKGRIVLADDHTWRVGIRTPGLVMEVYAGLGDHVTRGQILARYHADEVRDTRALYRAAISERDRATAGVAQAQRNRERALRLLDLKAGSVQQVEQLQQDLSNAEAAVRKAEIEIDRTRDVLEDDLRVPAEPKKDNPLADEVPIFAPATGYVIEKNITPGKTIELSADTFVIGDLSRVWMLASVSQGDLARVRSGQNATVAVSPDAPTHYAGRVTNLGQRLNPETRMMEVRIELNNPGNSLRPEMLATADIAVGGATAAVTVPSDAVQQVNGQDVVFVQSAPDRFAVRPVRTGATEAGRTPISEGLRAGESVVVSGSFTLKSQLLKATLQSE
ncbi:MAG: efflux RND transporter periplasmic adaptor subunit [Acidobacteriota bacterium]|nr:efflux RND transporter periplasmic adaptor subunit [Acidobacteriota bacterium]